MDKHAIQFIGFGIIAAITLLYYLVSFIVEKNRENRKQHSNRKRPISILIIAILGILCSVFDSIIGIIGILSFFEDGFYIEPLIIVLISILGFLCSLGLLKMKRWSMFLSLSIITLLALILIVTGFQGYELEIVFPLLVLLTIFIIILKNSKRFTT